MTQTNFFRPFRVFCVAIVLLLEGYNVQDGIENLYNQSTLTRFLTRSSNTLPANSLDRSSHNWTSLNQDEITLNLKLVQIDVSDNNITEFNSTMFSDHQDLEVLILSRNKMYDFPADTSFLSSISLERFDCISCGISTIFNATFSELIKLRELNLSGNNLSVIQPAAFSKQFFLRKLNFDFNKLTDLPIDMLKQSKVNVSVSMNHNSDFDFPSNRVLLKSKSLKEFQCNFCGITRIYEETFTELPNIETIHLNHNKILTINSKMFENSPNVSSLSIEQNRLNDFPMSVFDVIKKLKSLCIDGNPLLVTSKNAIKNYYRKAKLRENCTETDTKKFFENKFNPGISDAFIASYLLIILVAQATVIGILAVYCFKIVFTDKDDKFDYSSNVLNDHDAYNVS